MAGLVLCITSNYGKESFARGNKRFFAVRNYR